MCVFGITIESSAKAELSIDFMFLTLASRRKTAINKDGLTKNSFLPMSMPKNCDMIWSQCVSSLV